MWQLARVMESQGMTKARIDQSRNGNFRGRIHLQVSNDNMG